MYYTNRADNLKSYCFSKEILNDKSCYVPESSDKKDGIDTFGENATLASKLGSGFPILPIRLEDLFMGFSKQLLVQAGLMILLCLSFLGNAAQAQSLSSGDLAVIRINEDGVDGFSFVTLVDLPVGTSFFITEQGWRGETYKWGTNSEPHVQFTANTNYPAGTIFHFDEENADSFSVRVNSSNTVAYTLAALGYSVAGGDQVIIYTGSLASPTFITGLNSNDHGELTIHNKGTSDPITLWASENPAFLEGEINGSQTSRIPTGLSNGVNAISLSYSGVSEFDNAYYSGITTGTKSELATAINTRSNWTFSNDNANPFTRAFITYSFVVQEAATVPVVSTTGASGITENTVSLGGEVTDDGGAAVSDRGIVYNTVGTPTTADTKVQIGVGVGSFSDEITGLSAETTYFVRAYASNSTGTSYGDEVSFTTTAAPAASLETGDIAIIGFNSDSNPDELTLVALNDLPPGETVYISDYGWDGGVFDVSAVADGVISWNITTSVPAGTVIKLTISSNGTPSLGGGLSAFGTASASGWTNVNSAVASGGDNWFIYQGENPTAAPGKWIFGWANWSTDTPGANPAGSNGWQTAGSVNSTVSYLPTALTNGTNALALTGSSRHSDNMRYTGTRSGSKESLLASIVTESNWIGSETETQDINPGGTNFPGLNPIFTIGEVSVLLSSNPVLSFSNSSGFEDNIAEDGDGGAVSISDINIQVYPINNSLSLLDALSLEYHDDSEPDWTGYPAIVVYGGESNASFYGWIVKSENGEDFSLRSLDFHDWGNYNGADFTIEGFKDGVSKVTFDFFGNTDGSYIGLSNPENLSDLFLDVDEVRIYQADEQSSYIALNNIGVGTAVLASNNTPSVSSLEVTGNLTIGQTLTASYVYNDIDGDSESGTTYRWFRSDNNSGLNKSQIVGASSTTYVLSAADVGKFISVEVTPNDGTNAGSAVESERIGPVEAPLSSSVPELFFYKFDETGTTVTNYASDPPAGADEGTLLGTLTQGGTEICDGSLIGSGNNSSTSYLSTNWATGLSGSWTISFKTANIPANTTLYYLFGDESANSLRIFTNGVAGPTNWMLRGTGMTDVLIAGGAVMEETTNTWVYNAETGDIKAYLNGVLVNTVAQSSLSFQGSLLKVGGYGSNSGLNGNMDEFRLYSRALSPEEVLDIAVSCAAPITNADPVATAPSTPTVNEDDVAVELDDNFAVADEDGDDQMVTLTITGGTVSLGTAGITFGSGTNGSASFTASGTLAAINTALSSATFTPTPNLFGEDAGQISFISNDGRVNSHTATITFDIIGVNDDPTFTGLPASVTVEEDATNAYLSNALSNATFADEDAGNNEVTLILNVSQGALGYVNPTGTGVSIVGNGNATGTLVGTVADIEAYLSINTNVTYTPPANLSGVNAATLTVSANDGGNIGSGGGETLMLGQIQINITLVNDAPQVIIGTTPTVNEDDVAVQLTGLMEIVDVEVDDQTVTINVTGGTVNLGTEGITFDGSGNGSNSFTATGSLADINTSLAAATFTPTPDLSGENAGSISFVSNDGTANSNIVFVTFDIIAVNEEQTITFNEISEKIYGDPDFILGEATTDLGLTVTFTAADPSVVDITGNSATILKAGSTLITATQGGGEDADPAAQVQQTLVINKKELIVTANDNQTKVFGTSDPVFTYSSNGFAYEEDENVLSGSLSREAGENVGEYEIEIGTLANANYSIEFTNSPFSITPATVTGVTFIEDSFVFDGTAKFLAIEGTLPTGTSVNYTDNSRTDVGSQEVTATITGDNFTTLVLTANLSVTPAEITGITFDDGSFVFDGTAKSLAIEGTLPTGTSVTYADNSRTDVGSQEVTATITGSNYNTLVLTADLTVTPADVSGITFDDGSFVYDGAAKALAISGTLPDGTSVAYTDNNRTDVGTQEVTATITGSNYNTLVLTADLTVTPADITGIMFDDGSFVYDGTAKSLAIEGILPTGTSVNYTDNSRTDVGSQEVTATITGDNFTTLVLTADLTVTPADITGITFDDGSFVYDGTAKALAISGTLPDGTSVAYTDNNRTDVGTQEVTATITGTNFTTLVLTADLSVTPATVTGITFENGSFVYDGTAKSLAIEGILPTGTSVNYTDNSRTDVGSQEVTATITGDNFTTLVLTADLTVTPADITGITFDDGSFVYDGTAKSLAITGTLPDGTSVSYNNNSRTDVGSQEVTATITGDNFTTLVLTADLTVTPADITGIMFDDGSFVYDGTAKSLAIEGILPTGTSVNYTDNSRTDVGSQEVTATITGDNFTTLVLTADLTVTPTDITGITFDDGSFVYDGAAKALAISGTLPDGTSVAYTDKNRTDVGSQEVTATITGSNYTTLVLTADLTVTPADITGITFDDGSFVFDGTTKSLAIEGTLPTGTSVNYTDNSRTDVGSQEVTATITGDNFTTLVLTADLTVTPADITGITFDDGSFVYDGTAKSLAITGTLPDGTSVAYTDNSRTDVGSQEVTATISGSNYNTLVLTADLTVTPADITGITFDDGSFVYDGTAKSLAITGTLPDGTSVSYNNNSRTDVGTQEVTATITGTNFTTLVLTADLSVTPATVTGITFENGSFVYDGTAKSLAITGALPTGTSVNYGNNSRTDVGTQEVTATITGSNYNTLVLTADLTVTPADITGIMFDDGSFVYDGTAKSLAIEGILPTGTSVNYTDNSRTDVGSQEVTATITGDNFTTLVLTADLTVTPADITGITFDDGSFVYDGTAKSLAISGTLPDGTSVAYTDNNRTDVGSQEVTATITGSNYNTLVLTADLTVTPADVSGITFDDGSFVYDGTAKSLEISGTLPEGASVAYTNNSRTDVGTQEVTATITGLNYNTLVLTADLTVTPADVSGITFDDDSFVYDGTTKSLAITGTLPDGTSVAYTDNSRTDVGTQEVTATITGTNFTTLVLTADLSVTPATVTGITFENGSFVYDGTAKSLAITGTLPDGTSVSYNNNSRTDVGTQEVTATITGSNYNTLVLTADLSVTPADVSGIIFGDGSFVFDGTTKSLAISGTLPDGTSVAYTDNSRTDVGSQEVTATITGSNYNTLVLTADLTVTPADVSGITFDDDSFVFDGTAKSLAITGTLPDGTSVAYTDNSRTDVGSQEVTATITGSNYNTLVLTADLTVTPADVSGITFDDGSFVFDGAAKSLAIAGTLPDGTSVSYTNNSRTDVGTQEVTATITGSNYNTLVLTADLSVTPADIAGITFDDASFVFDGTAKSLAITGTLPDGTSVSYNNNSRTDVGTQEVTATITGSNYTTLVLTADLTVTPADVSGITFDDGSFVFDGTAKSLAITGTLPDGTSVAYTDNSRTDVGSQEVTATITGDNFTTLVLTADLTVTPADITGITFDDGSFVYDGTTKSLAISGTLPDGTSVAYTDNSRTDVGTQEVTATITGSNYNTLVLTANLSVTPADITGITFDDDSFVFDGTAKSLAITGTLPDGTSVAYTDNSRTDVGSQEVTATITGSNYNTLVLTADLTVTPADIAGITFGDGSFVYDGTAKSLAITGALPDGTSVSYSNNSRTDVGTQEATATITGSNFTTLVLTADLTVTPADVSGITFDDDSLVFDGTAKSLAIAGTLPDGTSVSYTNNSRTDLGTQEVTATVTGSNYNTLVLTADLTVTPADVSGITFDDGSFVFDGTTKSLAIAGTLPDGTSVSYTNNSRTDVGTQEVTATITGSNYNTLVLTADLSVTPADIAGITFDDASFVFDGTAKSLAITGTLPDGTSVSYNNNSRTDVGTQEVTATITGSNYTTLVLTADLTVTPADVSGITFDDGSFVFDGTAKSLAITGTLPDGTSVAYTDNSRTDVGTQEVTATITGDNFTTLVLTADLTVTPADVSGITFDDGSFVFDGTTKSLAITGTLPDGTSVAYTNNSRTDVGTQEVTATITGSNYNTLVLTADLSVTPADITGITFGDGSFVFDGTAKSLAITGTLPDGTSVAYTDNSRTDLGTQEVTATVTGSNYNTLVLTADLTVTPADVSGITFDDGSFVFDGAAKSLAITGTLPDGTSVAYTDNSRTDVGTQEVTATITGSNYNTLVLTADLTVTPADVSGITFDDGSFVFDGSAKSLAITGTLPDGTSVAYTDNSRRDVGTQEVTATITGSNYTTLVLIADLTVTPADITGITFDDGSFVFDGTAKSLAITGALPDGTSVSYSNNSRTDVGSQEVTATITGSNYTTLVLTADLTVTPADVSGITFGDGSFVFDGTAKSLAISGTLPDGTSVAYANNSRTDVGTQEVTATITGTNFTTLVLTADLSVTPAEITGITFDDGSFVFDGTAKSLAVTGTLPGTSVAYTDNSRTDVGTQEVTATITGLNYNTLVLTADLTVTPAGITGITFDDGSFVFDGTAKSLAITGTLPDGTSVAYTDNSRRDVGTQEVTATITGSNYNTLVLTADLSVTPATVTGITFENGSFVFDGTAKSLAITGTLPDGTSVAYTNNSRTDVGTQEVTATITGSNYNTLVLTADLTVTPADITGITFGDGSFVFDGTAKSLAITGTLPDGTSVAYTDNSRIDVGTQEVTATITGTNFTTLVLTADLSVTPATVTGITFENGSFVFDGTAKSLAITGTLPDGTSVAYTDNSRTDVGTQEVTATITGSNYNTLVLTADLTVTPADITGITFDDGSFVFDGTAKSLATTGTLPDGTSVAYTDNSRTDVGSQEVTATISGSNYNTLVLTADLMVTPADVSGITFDDGSFVFDGTAKSLAIEGILPTGTSVNYTDNSRTDVGTQEVTATLTGSNYNTLVLTAYLTVTPADVSGITFGDGSFVFDGTAKSLAIEGTLPTGTSIAYTDNSRTDVGSQEVTATISGSNFTTLVLTADLSVTPADVSGITFENGSFVFDGEVKSLAISGTLPDGTSVAYTDNSRTDVGTQEVTAKITGSNYNTLVLTADLSVTPATVTGITFENGSFVFDGTAKSLAITGTLPDGTSVAYTDNSRTDVGTQEVTATISGSDYTELVLTANLAITPATLAVTADPGQSKEAGSADPVLSYSVSGFVGGDDESIISGSLDREDGEEVGSYTINQGSLSAGSNYTIVFTEADFMVTEPANVDSDGDGVPDPVEEEQGTDPTDPDDYLDRDGDDVPDYVEEQQDTDPMDPGDYMDTDGDDVPDYVEEQQGTDLDDESDFVDADEDGNPDYVEDRSVVDFVIQSLDVKWGTETDELKIPEEVVMITASGEFINLAVTWDLSGYDPLILGMTSYSGTVELPAGLFNPDEMQPMLEITVLAKPAPQDVTLSADSFIGIPDQYFQKIGTFTVVDPTDDQHTFSLPEEVKDNQYFEALNGILFWSSAEQAQGRTDFTIVLIVTDRVGNVLEKEFSIIRERTPLDQLEVPNTFTPNGDGVNDTWGMPALRYYTGVRISVFAVGGDRLFYTEDADVRWNGVFNDKDMPVGAYLYVIEVGETGEIRRGMLNLIND